MGGMRPEDVYELVAAGDPRVSPDGSTIAYVVTSIDSEASEYRSAIWLARADGSEPPRRFTAGERIDGDPRWSPDGRYLAFTSTRDGDGKVKQLYVMPVAGGEPRRLTDLKENVAEPVWSRDGSRIAFSSRVRAPEYDEEDERKRAPRRFARLHYKLDNVGWTGDRRSHIFVVDVDGGEPRQVTHGDFDDQSPTWSPDGRRIAFFAGRDDDWDIKLIRDLYVVDAEGGEPERLTNGRHWFQMPSWSPDGRQIACQWQPGGWDHPRHGQIAVVDAESGEHRVLTQSLDRQCIPYPPLREPVWDGAEILFGAEDSGNTHLYRVSAGENAEPERVVGEDLTVTGWDSAGGTLAHTSTTATTLAELYVGDRRLTGVGDAFAEARELVDAERFTATSADGSEVEAWIMRPAGFRADRRYPVLLNIHGGPFTQYGNRFFDEFHVYSGAGYAVVYSNPRGSSGYSEEWGRAIRGPGDNGPGWGTVDYEDLMAVVDEALRRFDFCDPERVGVMGGSYGGYMTSWIVSHTNRFRAACSERAVNNMLSQYGSSDIGGFFKSYIGVFAFEDPERYLRISPSTYAAEIETPLLIMHSENDLRCDVEQGEHLFQTLRFLQRDVEFVRFPAEGHELSRSGSPRHRVQRFEVLLDWFARYLEPGRVVEREPVEASA